MKMMQAKDVNMQKRPLADFQDRKMKGNIVTEDFKSILQLAVLCVASSSTGRPSIGEVVDDLEKALKNTQLKMVSSIHCYVNIHNMHMPVCKCVCYLEREITNKALGWLAETKGEEFI